MKIKKWNLRAEYALFHEQADAYAPIPALPAFVLAARGYSPADAAEFLRIDSSKLHDPFLIPDMELCVARLQQAIEKGETVLVYGDYDVDGITATYLLLSYLRGCGLTVFGYFPSRQSEGYGLNDDAIDTYAQEGVTLIVTVDTGITAISEVEYAKSCGMDVIITDHHECGEVLPAAIAVVNPKRADSRYPFKELAGVGVAFKILCALTGDTEWVLASYCDFVALGTIADVMVIADENRVLVSIGLECLNATKNIGLRSLIRETGLESKRIVSSMVGYILSPRINAAGRVENASVALDLFLSSTWAEAEEICLLLSEHNRKRQSMESVIFTEAKEMLAERGFEPKRDKFILLIREGWHTGLIGIVASRLVEAYGCPTILVSLDGGIGKGSGRSVRGFNLYDALLSQGELFDKYGGHELAVGFSLGRARVDALYERLTAYVQSHIEVETLKQVIDIESDLSLADITMTNAEYLEVLEPYGSGNHKPIFCMHSVRIDDASPAGSRNTKLFLSKNGVRLYAIYFGMEFDTFAFSQGDFIDIAFHLEINCFRDTRSLQLCLKDAVLSASVVDANAQSIALYEAYMQGATLSPPEAASLLANRAELVEIWRFIKRGAAPLTAQLNLHYSARTLFGTMKTEGSIAKLLLCLTIFQEFSLLDFSYDNLQCTITFSDVNGKTNIANSEHLHRLRELAEQA